MTTKRVAGDGVAPVIPFPLHRVSPPVDDDHSAADTGDPVSVDDLRELIKNIESPDTPLAKPVAPRALRKEDVRAKNIALHQLGVSGRSEAEVRDRLTDRGISPEVIETEVERLLAVGLIDDLALATDLVESGRRKKKLGDSALTQTLRRRKIPAHIIDQVLTADEYDSDVALYELATDRARSLRHLEFDVGFRRLVGFLQRRGYGGSQVYDAARRALEDSDGLRQNHEVSPLDLTGDKHRPDRHQG